jgi:hypothetical protein
MGSAFACERPYTPAKKTKQETNKKLTASITSVEGLTLKNNDNDNDNYIEFI